METLNFKKSFIDFIMDLNELGTLILFIIAHSQKAFMRMLSV